MRPSQAVLSGAAVGTIIGTANADLNKTHVFNPRWPRHARFHAMAGWCTITASQLLALWLTWRPGRDAAERDLGIRVAAMVPVVAWTPFFIAVATPGAAVEDDPGDLRRIAGIPINLVPATLVPLLSLFGYWLHRHKR